MRNGVELVLILVKVEIVENNIGQIRNFRK